MKMIQIWKILHNNIIVFIIKLIIKKNNYINNRYNNMNILVLVK